MEHSRISLVTFPDAHRRRCLADNREDQSGSFGYSLRFVFVNKYAYYIFNNQVPSMRLNGIEMAPRTDIMATPATNELYRRAESGALPEGFDQWSLVSDLDKTATIAHVAAEHGHLPPGFGQWDLANEDGWTVAHAAARSGHLPADFDHWGWADHTGRTVAHVAAWHGHLPADFDQWGLADKNGKTVLDVALESPDLALRSPDLRKRAEAFKASHPAIGTPSAIDALLDKARNGTLPEGFDQWDRANKDGWTVAHEAAYYNHLPSNFDQWALSAANGWTVAHAAANRGYLPENFKHWNLAHDEGRTVAHTAAFFGHLPANFDQWGLTDDDGLTVFEVAMSSDKLTDEQRSRAETWAASQSSMPDTTQPKSGQTKSTPNRPGG